MNTDNTALANVATLLDSYKSKAAFLAPFILSLGTTVVSWIVSGEFNENEVRTIIGGAVLAGFASLATYLAPAGAAVVEVTPGSEEVFDGPDDDGIVGPEVDDFEEPGPVKGSPHGPQE